MHFINNFQLLIPYNFLDACKLDKPLMLFFLCIHVHSFYISKFFLHYVQILNYFQYYQLISYIFLHDVFQFQTGYEQIEQTEFRRGKSRFYLGKKNGMWGMFRIKRQPKHEPEIISTLEPIYYNSEEALLAFKNSKHNTVRKHKRTKNATTEESKENIN